MPLGLFDRNKVVLWPGLGRGDSSTDHRTFNGLEEAITCSRLYLCCASHFVYYAERRVLHCVFFPASMLINWLYDLLASYWISAGYQAPLSHYYVEMPLIYHACNLLQNFLVYWHCRRCWIFIRATCPHFVGLTLVQYRVSHNSF